MHKIKKIFVTGANGFIGRAIMERYKQKSIDICGVDITADPSRNVVRGDVSNAGEWQEHAKGCDIIFHTAAVVSNTASADMYQKVSVGSVKQVVAAAKKHHIARVVHISSIAAYGLNFDADQDENCSISVLSGSSYCDAKAASEHGFLAAHAAGDICTTIIRPGDVYGPGSRPWVLIPLTMISKKQFVLPAMGRGIFSPVYIDNLVDGIVLAAEKESGKGQIFNITDGAGIECREFFNNHYKWLGKNTEPVCLPTRVAEGITSVGSFIFNTVLNANTEIDRSSLAMLSRKATYSIDKARDMLGYVPVVSLTEGMARTEAWLKENRGVL
ncbi:MAG: hypothetical protein COW58_12410 [Thalassolituus sp. CG17_big_fil_post_rev_8_21_14_2_50_53_8]|nr:MAG: hypothetical protein COW58_12410 [Thalassolituus sp. CG17_big_fil_post_rev_8_21_14_2_50_53_8]